MRVMERPRNLVGVIRHRPIVADTPPERSADRFLLGVDGVSVLVLGVGLLAAVLGR